MTSIADIQLLKAKDPLPNGYSLRNQSYTGSDIYLRKSSSFLADKNSYLHLAYKRSDTDDYVVTDLRIVDFDKGETPPPGFCKIESTTNSGPANLKSEKSKIYLFVKRELRSVATEAIVDIIFIVATKKEEAPSYYIKLDKDLSDSKDGFYMYVHKTPISKTQQERALGAANSAAVAKPAAPMLTQQQSISEAELAVQGVVMQIITPGMSSTPSAIPPALAHRQILSRADVEQKYKQDFALERVVTRDATVSS